MLASTAEQAAALPFAGRRVPEFDRDELREMIKRGYRIVYLVSDEQIEILTVSEGHRQLPQDLLNG